LGGEDNVSDLDDQDNAAYVRAVHDKGLKFDLGTMSRRRMLATFGGVGAAGALALVGISGNAAAADALAEVESETAGPFPADGSNGPDVRTETGIVRSDIRTSFGDLSGTADGIPLQFSLVVLDLDGAPLPDAAVYVWHCDRAGNYSLYSTDAVDQNYLRGIQVTDETGTVTFSSIFPACYSGRWPHIHFEVYSSLDDATTGAGPIRKTSQIAIPEQYADEVYATDGYDQSVINLSQITLESDMVFGDDDAARELATVTGNVTDGYVAVLTIAVDPTAVETGGGGGGPGGPGGPPPSGGTPPSGPPHSGPPPTTPPTTPPTATPTPTDSATPTPTDSPSPSDSATPTDSVSPSASSTSGGRVHRRHRRWWWPF
jgi:protocatechuate 3,4-dioxygenase beta subunit